MTVNRINYIVISIFSWIENKFLKIISEILHYILWNFQINAVVTVQNSNEVVCARVSRSKFEPDAKWTNKSEIYEHHSLQLPVIKAKQFGARIKRLARVHYLSAGERWNATLSPA